MMGDRSNSTRLSNHLVHATSYPALHDEWPAPVIEHGRRMQDALASLGYDERKQVRYLYSWALYGADLNKMPRVKQKNMTRRTKLELSGQAHMVLDLTPAMVNANGDLNAEFIMQAVQHVRPGTVSIRVGATIVDELNLTWTNLPVYETKAAMQRTHLPLPSRAELLAAAADPYAGRAPGTVSVYLTLKKHGLAVSEPAIKHFEFILAELGMKPYKVPPKGQGKTAKSLKQYQRQAV